MTANQRWVPTGITVAKDQQVRFDASGEVQLSPDDADVATTAGSKIGRRISNGPLPGELAGALVGRVGNGRAFGIGNQAGPLSMPERRAALPGASTTTTSTTTGAPSTSTVDGHAGDRHAARTHQPARPAHARGP